MTATMLAISLIGVVIAASWMDLRERRIPNVLTVGALLVAISLRAAPGGESLLDGLLGVGLATAVMLPLFSLGGVGGGDAKLLIAVGAFLGPKGFVVAMLATAIAGGLLAVTYATRRGVIIPMIYNAGSLTKNVVSLGRSGERTTRHSEGAVTVPYALAIAVGAVFAVWRGGLI